MMRKYLKLPQELLKRPAIKALTQRVYVMAIPLFFTVGSEASYTKLAKKAGLSHERMQSIIKKVVKHESTTGNYTVKNRSSGAYGRYQIMPNTAKAYAHKLHIPYAKWKSPTNQDKIFKAIMHDNINALKRNGIAVNAFSLYGTHQQGAGGFNAIVKNKKLTKQLERNIRQNLPKKLRHTSKANLKSTWMSYWKKKMS